jgi:hypothetical protein
MKPRLAQKIGFELFQAFVLGSDLAMQSDGFGDKFFQLSVAHR